MPSAKPPFKPPFKTVKAAKEEPAPKAPPKSRKEEAGEDVVKLPKTIGGCADLLYTTREARLKLKKEVERLEALEGKLKQFIIDNVPKSDSTGAVGKLCRVTVVPKVVPTVKDWNKLWAYIVKNKAYDLMQKRLSDTAVTSRWEAGRKIDGVEEFNAITVSINKL